MYIGMLPWSDIDLNEKNIPLLIIKKNPQQVYEFCKFHKLPNNMLKMVEYVFFSNKKKLNYNYILMLLRNELYRLNYTENFQYDWL